MGDGDGEGEGFLEAEIEILFYGRLKLLDRRIFRGDWFVAVGLSPVYAFLDILHEILSRLGSILRLLYECRVILESLVCASEFSVLTFSITTADLSLSFSLDSTEIPLRPLSLC